jgi:4-methylaminobutanoate oxidase (formaldehyde-forming)
VGGHTVGGAVALGYAAGEGRADARYVQAGRYEITVSVQRYPAAAHLRAAYDPGRQRVLS